MTSPPFDLKAHLRALTETHAPSGHEGAVRDLLRETWAELVDDFDQDGLGSLIGIKRGSQTDDQTTPRRKIMLAAHMDEIGMMVNGVQDGFIFVHRISGVDARLLPAQTVMVHASGGGSVEALPALVAAKPPHLQSAEAQKKYPGFDELVIDLGLPADEVARRVRLGDLITMDAPMIDLNGTRVAGKALDDRACVAAVTVCLRELQRLRHTWDVYATATVQEETALLGAKTAAYRIAPDIAIALDVGFAPQPGVDADSILEMGGGPGIGIGPNFHLRLNEKIRETAKRHEIKLQDDPIPGASGTDAWTIQVAREGIPTALLGVPLRSMHSPVETCDTRDIERAGRLLAHFIAELEPDFLATIAWPDVLAEPFATHEEAV